MHPKVVINADDFGRDRATNKAIIMGFRKGFLSSASLMPVGEDFGFAVSSAKKYSIPVGVHVVLNSEKGWSKCSPLTKDPKLTPDGKFFPDSDNSLDKSLVPQVEREVFAQFERVLKTGVKPWFFDSHMYCLSQRDGRYVGLLDRLWGKYRIPFIYFVKNAPLGNRASKFVYGGKSLGGASYEGMKHRLRRRIASVVPFRWIAVHVSTSKKKEEYTRRECLRLVMDGEINRWLCSTKSILYPRVTKT